MEKRRKGVEWWKRGAEGWRGKEMIGRGGEMGWRVGLVKRYYGEVEKRVERWSS